MKNETVLFNTVTPHDAPVPIADLLTDIEAVIKKLVILFLAGNGAMRGIINSGNTRRTAYVLRLSGSRNRSSATPPSPPSGERDGVRGQFRESSQVGQASRLPVGAASSRAFECAPVHTPNASPIEVESPRAASDGAAIGLKKYSCWCPKVIAMIGQVPDTIADRSIIVQMSRKLVSETCAPLAELNTTEIRAKCARFALDATQHISQAAKIRAEGLNDRAADTFDPLFIIARLAGEGWEKKLHTAALALASSADNEHSGSGLILDILDIFFDYGREKMFSRDLVTLLRNGGMKSHLLKPSAVNEQQLAKVLHLYGIKPINIRIGAKVQRGYIALDFREVLERYIPKADIVAYVAQTQQRMQLRADAAKARAVLEQAVADAAEKGLSVSDATAMIRKVRDDLEFSDEIPGAFEEKL